MEMAVCDNVIEACEAFGLKEIMAFRYNWNTEIIAQFHAYFYFSNSDSTIHWTTNGIHFAVDIVTFACLLGLGSKDLQRDKIHNEQQLSVIGMKNIYRNPSKADGGTKGLESFFYILNNLFHATLTPKGGDATQIHAFARNLLMRFAKDGRPFNVTNFMWEELIEAENDSRKGFPYAPYIMYVIEKVSGITFRKDVEHSVLKITRTSPPGASRSQRPSHVSSSGNRSGRPKSLGRWVWETLFGMCKKQATDVYEMRKGI